MEKKLFDWPDGRRGAASISWDIDAESGLTYKYGDGVERLIAMRSFLRYGPTIALPRLIDVLKQLGLKQTFFVPGWVIDHYPAAIEQLAEHGHEVALHGYLHERTYDLTADQEEESLLRSIDSYVKVLGVRPEGWRAPGFAFSDRTAALLIDNGFKYDSSLMGDDVPYLLGRGDKTLVEIPIGWRLDDWPQYMHSREFEFMMQIASPSRAMEVFRAEFDAAVKYGAMFVAVWHPFLSGRLAQLDKVIEFINYMKGVEGVWLTTVGQIAEHAGKVLANTPGREL